MKTKKKEISLLSPISSLELDLKCLEVEIETKKKMIEEYKKALCILRNWNEINKY